MKDKDLRLYFKFPFHYKFFEIETNMGNFKFKYGEVMHKADMEKIVASLIQPIIEQIRTGSVNKTIECSPNSDVLYPQIHLSS
ncbi:MAG: hypothetical protein IPO07_16980 [Haliscomenobacter sp.]|nr:hypothetical protein [Haliscomenobacter sp.]MBK9490277.1 hypothetical protein [Haliscomenobacter sp.]